MKKIILILWIYCLIQFDLYGQQPLNRNAIPTYSNQIYDSTDVFLSNSSFYGELQRGIGSVGNEMYWNIKFGGIIELYRFTNSSINFTLNHEFNATPYNDISFDPVGARWEENINYSYKNSNSQYTFGYMHRCKHELDNFDPPENANSSYFSVLTKRVVLLSGPFIELQKKFYLIDSSSLSTLLRFDYTPISGDFRFPNNNKLLRWDEIDGEISLAAKYTYYMSEKTNAYTKLWLNNSFFRNEGIKSNYRIELGGSILSKKNELSFFVASEYLYDDLSNPFPQPSSTIYVGFRINGRNFW